MPVYSIIQLFSLLCVNSRTDCVLQPWCGKEKENSGFKPVKLRLKIDLVSYPARAEGLVNMVYIHVYMYEEPMV